MKRFNNALDILVVMDPIASIAPNKDSSFAMMLEAQRRGWRVLYAGMDDIWIRNGQAWGKVTELQLIDDPSDWFEMGSVSVEPLEEIDVILMRKDPPFDMEYIYATYILERAEIHGALVVNHPQGLPTANEKVFVSWFPDCLSPSLVSRSLEKLSGFIDEHERVVVKPLDRMAGKSVFLTGTADPNRHVLLETMTDFGSRYILAQRYLPEVLETGDSRILLIDGEPIPYALVRFAPAGDHRANMSVGARTEVRPLNAAELRICDRLSPVLREIGLLFVGIDVIGDHLTEINVTSPTGIRELDRARELNVAGELLNSIEAKINRSRNVNLHQKAT